MPVVVICPNHRPGLVKTSMAPGSKTTANMFGDMLPALCNVAQTCGAYLGGPHLFGQQRWAEAQRRPYHAKAYRVGATSLIGGEGISAVQRWGTR